MFDGVGRLVVEPDLHTAQALCILQMHDILTKDKGSVWGSRFHGAVSLNVLAFHLFVLIGRSRPRAADCRGPRSSEPRASNSNPRALTGVHTTLDRKGSYPAHILADTRARPSCIGLLQKTDYFHG